jgi:hypothetical protein
MSITEAVTPLRMIFWGGLLCIFDLSFSSTTSINNGPPTGFRFDVLNDFVGMLLITIAVSKLSAFAIDPFYRSAMRFVFVCAVLNCIEAFVDHFVFPAPAIVDVAWNLLGLASLAATVVFCTCMHRLSWEFSLHRSADSWLTTRWLVIFLWVIPLGLLDLFGLGAMLTGQSFHLDIGLLMLPVLAVLIVPLVHLFISTSRMRRDAEASDYKEDVKQY